MILRKIVLFGVMIIGVCAGGLYALQSRKLTLEQSIDLAFQYNRTLAISEEKVEEARARLGEARTGFFPRLTGNANYTKLDVAPFMPGKVFADFSGAPSEAFPKRIVIGRDEIIGMGIRFQQPLFTGFSILNGYRMAKEGVKASRAEYQRDSNNLIYQVSKVYWGVLKAEKFVEVAQEAVIQVQGHVRDLENMYDVGMLTRNDLLKARVQLSNTKLMLIQAKNGAELAKKVFCNVLGVPLNTDVVLVEELSYESIKGVSIEEASQRALYLRPEILMFKAGLGIGKRSVDLASAGYLPNLSLLIDYGYQKPNREYSMEFYTTWTISLVASMNLFDWGATHYKQQQARRQLFQLEESFENLKSGIRLEVAQAVLMLYEAEERISVAEDNVRQAEENERVTGDLFHQGMATNTDYLDANTLLVQAKTDYISALADYKLAKAQLELATGIIGKGE